MQNMNSSDGLRNAIQSLEAQQAFKGQLLKEQLFITYESLRPVNLLINTIRDLASTPNLLDNILGTATGIATGYLSKKVFIGASVNLFRKIIGSVLQVGVTNAFAQHPEGIKSFGHLIIQYFLRKKEKNLEKL
jgi:hypothetical protein